MRKYLIVLIALNVLITLTSIRQITNYLGETGHGEMFVVRSRLHDILSNMDDLAAGADRKIILVGSSAWQYFLNPLHLDKALAGHGVNSTSYNLAFAGLIGPSMLAFTYRLNHEFESRRLKIGATVIELSPITLGKVFYYKRRIEIDTWILGVFYSPGMWRQFFANDPLNAAYLLFTHLVQPFDWKYVPAVTRLLPTATRVHEFPNRGVAALWLLPEFQEKQGWNPALRGLTNWNLPATSKLFEKGLDDIHQADRWASLNKYLAGAYGLNDDFSYDRRLVDMVVESVAASKGFSHKTFVVIFPYCPSVQALADKFIDYDYLKRKIFNETGVRVLDFRSSLKLNDGDFADALHPRFATMDRFLDLLAEKTAPELKTTAPPAN